MCVEKKEKITFHVNKKIDVLNQAIDITNNTLFDVNSMYYIYTIISSPNINIVWVTAL